MLHSRFWDCYSTEVLCGLWDGRGILQDVLLSQYRGALPARAASLAPPLRVTFGGVFAMTEVEAPLTVPPLAANDAAIQRMMRQFFDATMDAVVFLNRDYRFTFLNRRARELFSPLGEVLGTSLFESLPDVVFEESPFVGNCRRSMGEGLPGKFEAYYPEPLNLWLQIESYPAVDGIMIFFRDISEQKQAHEELRKAVEEKDRQHAELETVYRTAPIGLALFDAKEFRYQRLNDRQAAFFGMKPDEVVGQNVMELAPIDGLLELFDQVRRGEPVVNYPLEGALATDPEGTRRYWTVSYFPVHGPDGQVESITTASLEITQQKRAERALIESEKLAVVGRLASSIAHEINNPLESVTNLLFLARTSQDLAQVHGYLDTAERELRRVSAITNQTLRFHKQATSPQAVTATALMESVLSVYQGRVVNSGVRIEERARAHTEVRCFEGEIRQVISNLVSNALDAMPNGGRLLLRSREGTNGLRGERGVTITIADTGSGMSPQTAAKLFEPFFTTKGIMGTGLGLWVSQEIADRHRGVLRMRSSQGRQHHGSVFSLFLPFDAVTREG